MGSLQGRIETVRGPASYSAGGFDVPLGEIGDIGESSGRLVAAFAVSSSTFVPNVVDASGNIATIMLHDMRSGGNEVADGTDASPLQVAIVYGGF